MLKYKRIRIKVKIKGKKMGAIMLKKTTKDKIIDYISYFFIYSCWGWIIETIYAVIIHGQFIKRGFLFGPLCPIYGFGAVILLLATKTMYGKPFQKLLIARVLFTLFEYVVSFLLEAAFGLRWWDYSNDFLNIHGRVSLMYTIFWGLIGLILLEKLHPLVENFIQNIEVKIKKNEKLIIVYVLIALLILDFILSRLKYLKIF